MVRPETKKNLAGDIPAELHDHLILWTQDHKDVKVRQCLQAMTELWLMLPERLQAILLITKHDSEGFRSITSEISEKVLTFEDAFTRKSDHASDFVRRMFLLLKDYAETGMGITTCRDLNIAFETIHFLLRWIEIDTLEGITDADQKALKGILSVLDSWLGIIPETAKPITIRQTLRNIVERTKAEQPFEGKLIKIDTEGERMLKELTNLLGPKSKKQKKHKRG